MNDLDLILIERYYRNELSDAERLAVEQRISEDSDFKADVQHYAQAMKAIHLYGREVLKQELKQRPLMKEKPRSGSWQYLLFFLVLALIGYGIWKIWPEKPAPIPPSATINPSQPAAIDTPVTLPPNSPPSQARINTKKLFAEVFHPYNPDISGSGTRSPNTTVGKSTDIDELKRLTRDGNYAECLTAFEHLSHEDQSKAEAMFFKANSLLALGKVKESAVLFEEVASNEQSSYAGEAKWYAALCALAKGNLPVARKWLQDLASSVNASTAQRDKAEKLIKRLR